MKRQLAAAIIGAVPFRAHGIYFRLPIITPCRACRYDSLTESSSAVTAMLPVFLVVA